MAWFTIVDPSRRQLLNMVLERLQQALKRLMLPRAKQGYRVSPVSISRVERPAPSIRTHARFAVIKLITVVEDRDAPSLHVDHEHAGIELVPSLNAYSDHRAPPKDRIAQYLANLPCCERRFRFVRAVG